jgi:hypothetical protein
MTVQTGPASSSPDRWTRAYYFAGLAAALACFASIMVFVVAAAPGFSVLKDRAKVERLIDPALIDPAMATAVESSRAG